MNSPSTWAWKYSLDRLREEIDTLFQNRIFTVKDGLMAHEELWETASVIINDGFFRREKSEIARKYNYSLYGTKKVERLAK